MWHSDYLIMRNDVVVIIGLSKLGTLFGPRPWILATDHDARGFLITLSETMKSLAHQDWSKICCYIYLYLLILSMFWQSRSKLRVNVIKPGVHFKSFMFNDYSLLFSRCCAIVNSWLFLRVKFPICHKEHKERVILQIQRLSYVLLHLSKMEKKFSAHYFQQLPETISVHKKKVFEQIQSLTLLR